MSKRQFATANVKFAAGVHAVRFLSNGKIFRATTAGKSRLRFRQDGDEIVIRSITKGHQETLRIAGANMGKAFAKAVDQFWS